MPKKMNIFEVIEHCTTHTGAVFKSTHATYKSIVTPNCTVYVDVGDKSDEPKQHSQKSIYESNKTETLTLTKPGTKVEAAAVETPADDELDKLAAQIETADNALQDAEKQLAEIDTALEKDKDNEELKGRKTDLENKIEVLRTDLSALEDEIENLEDENG